MMIRMFIDDERQPPLGSPWVVIRSFEELDVWMEENPSALWPDFVSFDHDLGPTALTGMVIAKVMVEADLANGRMFPKGFNWTVHSQNPVGAQNIDSYLRSYFNFKKQHLDK